MSIPTNADILSLLVRLDHDIADDLETLWLDFKPWTDPKDDMRVAIEYAVCMANSEGGVVVFGVADRTRGRASAIHGAKSYILDVWRRAIYEATRPNLNVEVEELSVPEGTGKLLLVRIPKGASPPYGTAQGLFKKRVGKNCMGLDPQSFAQERISTGTVDWSGMPAEGVTPADLDSVEIARARNVLRALKAGSDLLRLSDAEFLGGLRAVVDGRVTHTGLLLFGRLDVLENRCPQHQVQYVLQRSETEVTRNDLFRFGLLNALERLEQAFTGPTNPEQELTVGLIKVRIAAFPLEVVREAVLNAVTHRDYSDPGKVMVRHTTTELIVTSPGGFVAGITPQNILRHESKTWNQTLANAFLKLGLVEQAGVGRKRIFIPMLSFGRKVPVYETDGTRVTLTVFGAGFDERMAKLVAKWRTDGREIDLDGLLILTFLRDHAFIDTLSASELLQLSRVAVRSVLDQFAQPTTGILERRGRTAAATFHLTKGVAKDLLGKAAYTQTKGINPIRYAEMVRAFVEDFGSITPQECRELLGLGESDSAKVEVSRMFKKWCGTDGFLRREGKPPKVRYYLKT